jgi:iron complex outermembrane receptor protein
MKIRLLILSLLTSSFAFAADITTLSPTVVTATKTEAKSFDLPVSIDVVGKDVLQDGKVGASISEVSQRIPGVVINNRNNYAQELAISSRGFGARSAFGVKGVRLYIDGIPLNTADGQGASGSITFDSLDRIEFMRGPFSALYGNSSGGVVQAFTRDGAKDPTLSGSFSYGKWDTFRESSTFEGQAGNLNYIVSASEITSDGYRDFSKFKKDNLNSKFTYQISADTKATVLLNYNNQPYTLDPQSLSPSQYLANPKQSASTSYSAQTRLYRQQTYTGFILDHNLSEKQSIKLSSFYGIRDNLQYLATSASEINRNYGGLDFRWNLNNTLFSKPFNLTAGLNYEEMEDKRKRYCVTALCTSAAGSTGNKIKNSRDELQTAYNFDQYVQASFEPTDQWLLMAGIRHSKVTFNTKDQYFNDPNVSSDTTNDTTLDDSGIQVFTNTSPVFGATYKITPRLNLYANYGRGFETPTFAEMGYSDPATGAGPNLSMTPSRTKNYEFGVKTFITDNTRINLALFKVDAKNEIIAYGYDSTTKFTSYASTAQTERKGIELSIDSRLPNNFNFYAAYSMMDAEFRNRFSEKLVESGTTTVTRTIAPGLNIPATYKNTGFAELSWKYPSLGFSTATEVIYFSDTYAYDNNLMQYRPGAYTIANVRGSLEQKIDRWTIKEFVRIDNIFDRTYVSNVKVNSTTPFEPGLDRNYTLGLSASYKF